MTTTTTTTTTTTEARVEAYRHADRATKARMMADTKKAVEAFVADGNLAAAQEALQLVEAFKATSATVAERPDYEHMVATRIATLRRAADVMASGHVTGLPDDVELDFDRVTELLGAVEVDPVEESKLTAVKVGTRGPKKFTIRDWIADAMADAEPEVWLKISTIRGLRDEAPSAGAIGAAITRGDLPEGVEAGHDAAGKVALRRVA